MRQSGTFGHEFHETVTGITGIVENVVSVSQKTLSRPFAAPFRDRGEGILVELGVANTSLTQLGQGLLNSPSSKSLKQKVASCSYEIAKHVKELISVVEGDGSRY